jgi:SAM-dependent methyltransferase
MKGSAEMASLSKSFIRKIIPRSFRRKISQSLVWPPLGQVRLGHLRRTSPIGKDFGTARGMVVDRYYIEKFLSQCSSDIQGHVLEIKSNAYTKRYGGNRVTKSDVLHKVEGNSEATIIADLTKAEHIPSNTFDTIIFTQTLQFIYDFKAAAATLHRILKPGGVLLATVSGIAQISRYDYEMWGDYWRFTSLSARNLFEEFFPPESVSVTAYGNVLTAISFLAGLACEDLRREELDVNDPDYEILIAIRAVKPEDIV